MKHIYGNNQNRRGRTKGAWGRNGTFLDIYREPISRFQKGIFSILESTLFYETHSSFFFLSRIKICSKSSRSTLAEQVSTTRMFPIPSTKYLKHYKLLCRIMNIYSLWALGGATTLMTNLIYTPPMVEGKKMVNDYSKQYRSRTW